MFGCWPRRGPREQGGFRGLLYGVWIRASRTVALGQESRLWVRFLLSSANLYKDIQSLFCLPSSNYAVISRDGLSLS